MLSALLLTNLYSSSFYSLLTIPLSSPTIETLADLEKAAASSDDYQILTWANSSILVSLFQAADTPDDPDLRVLSALGAHIRRHQQKGQQQLFTDEVQQFRLIEKTAWQNWPPVVILTSRTYLNVKFRKRKLFSAVPKVGAENLITYFTGMVFPKRSPLTKPFDTV